MAPWLTDMTRQEEEEVVEEEEKEAFQHLQERKDEAAGPTWLLSTQSMMGDIQELHALGISTNKNKQENKNITFGSLEGSRIMKRLIWALFSDEMEKGYKFLFICKDWPFAGACRQTKHFFCFFPFLLYVGFVPASDHLGIFSIDWQCNFLLQILSKNSTIEKKRNSVQDFLSSHSGRNPFHFLSNIFCRTKTFSLSFF
jgi:hypothetical protein